MVMLMIGLYLCWVVVVVVAVVSGFGVSEVGRTVMGVGEATGVVREIWAVMFETDDDAVVGQGRVVLGWNWADVSVGWFGRLTGGLADDCSVDWLLD
jgi:hypothetical protein